MRTFYFGAALYSSFSSEFLKNRSQRSVNKFLPIGITPPPDGGVVVCGGGGGEVDGVGGKIIGSVTGICEVTEGGWVVGGGGGIVVGGGTVVGSWPWKFFKNDWIFWFVKVKKNLPSKLEHFVLSHKL